MSRKHPPVSGKDADAGRAERIKAADYDVGYGKPPKATQFGPGNRANPHGRPKGTPNHRTALKAVLEKPIPIKVGNRIRHVPQWEVALQVLMNKAMKGDVRAMAQLLAEGRRAGLFGEAADGPEPAITQDDEAILASFIRRTGSMSVEDAAGAPVSPEGDLDEPGGASA